MLLVRTEHAGLDARLGMVTQTLLRLLGIIAAVAKIAQDGFPLTYICWAVQTGLLLLPVAPLGTSPSVDGGRRRWSSQRDVPLEALLPVPSAQSGKVAAIPKTSMTKSPVFS